MFLSLVVLKKSLTGSDGIHFGIGTALNRLHVNKYQSMAVLGYTYVIL